MKKVTITGNFSRKFTSPYLPLIVQHTVYELHNFKYSNKIPHTQLLLSVYLYSMTSFKVSIVPIIWKVDQHTMANL